MWFKSLLCVLCVSAVQASLTACADSPAPTAAATARPVSTPELTPDAAADTLGALIKSARSDDATTQDEAVFHGVARELVLAAIRPNKLGVDGATFRVKRNPAGPGAFVYNPDTSARGASRPQVWWVRDESTAFAMNSPAKMITPTLDFARGEGPPTFKVIAYVFEGKPLTP